MTENNTETTQQESPSIISAIEQETDQNNESRTDNVGGGESGEEERIFDGSTHSYLIYFNPCEKGRGCKNMNDFILGAITMLIQFVLYSIMIKEGFEQINGGKIPVITNWDNCLDVDTNAASWSGWGGGSLDDAGSLECQTGEPNANTIMGGFTLSCILFVYFIAYDILACIKIWFKVPGKWAKFMGCIVFFEAGFAFYTGVVFAFIAVGNGSSYDAIVNCIGVLFVHDLDEKMYEACELIKTDEMTGKLSKKFCCCCQNCMKCACIICVMISSILVGFMCIGIIASQINYDSDTAADSWSSSP